MRKPGAYMQKTHEPWPQDVALRWLIRREQFLLQIAEEKIGTPIPDYYPDKERVIKSRQATVDYHKANLEQYQKELAELEVE